MPTNESRLLVNPSIPDQTPDNTVIFRGDGEPKPPEALIRRLAEISCKIEQDSYSQGGIVEQLEKRFAQMLGKEAALFFPTGTMANHLAIRKLCGVNARAVVPEQSHLYHDSGDCVSRLSNINLIPLAKGRPCFNQEELEEAFDQARSGRVSTPIGAVMIESPVRRQMGQVVPFDQIQEMTDFCRGNNMPTHLDGARLYMMSAATGISPQEYSQCFDTVYVSLYKYFGAPFGAILAGTSEFVEGLFHDRRMFGGGLASSWVAAALALNGAEDFEARFQDAMAQGRDLIAKVNALSGISIEAYENGSNIYPVAFDSHVDIKKCASALRDEGVILPTSETGAQMTINTTLLRKENSVILQAFKYALNRE